MMTVRSMVPRVALVLLLTMACRPADRDTALPGRPGAAGLPEAVARNRLRGVVLGKPQEKPDFHLTSMDGHPFDFRRDTDGRLTLLFFGYTHCPDVCPVQMADLGRVIGGLPDDVAGRITVVFVTTDPARDTPAQLKQWLGNFNPDFIGLTGTPEQLRDAQIASGLLPAAREASDTGGPSAYFVSHAAQVIAFTSDNLAHIEYPFGIRQQDWANDLPILVRGWPAQ